MYLGGMMVKIRTNYSLRLIMRGRHWMLAAISPWSGLVYWLDLAGVENEICDVAKRIIHGTVHSKYLVKITKNSRIYGKNIRFLINLLIPRIVDTMFAALCLRLYKIEHYGFSIRFLINLLIPRIVDTMFAALCMRLYKIEHYGFSIRYFLSNPLAPIHLAILMRSETCG